METLTSLSVSEDFAIQYQNNNFNLAGSPQKFFVRITLEKDEKIETLQKTLKA